MTGIEKPSNNVKYIRYVCDCGEDTEYGIYRFADDNDWAIESCCGGGCNAASYIKYCPYCGEKIQVRVGGDQK